MLRVTTATIAALFASAFIAAGAIAEGPMPYGTPISLDNAKKTAEVAAAEAQKNGWGMAIAIVDPAGMLVYFEKLENTQNGSVHVSIAKARSAALFRRPTKAFEDALVGGRQAILALPDAIPLEGGIPLVSEGKIVGAIGVSGGTSVQDGQVAKAAADGFK